MQIEKKDNSSAETTEYPRVLVEHIQELEKIIDDLQQQILLLRRAGRVKYRNDILTTFFRDCKEILSQRETIVFCLKLSGYTHKEIEHTCKPLSLSKSVAQRTFMQAVEKLSQFYQKGDHSERLYYE